MKTILLFAAVFLILFATGPAATQVAADRLQDVASFYT